MSTGPTKSKPANVKSSSNTQLHIQAQGFSLKRFPPNQFDKSLRAWDAADEYMINYMCDNHDLSTMREITIVNDSFGALTCAIAKLAPEATINVYTDSYMAELGIIQNAKACNLDSHIAASSNKGKIRIHSSMALAKTSTSPDLVLLKIPRTLSFLAYNLIAINQHINEKTVLIAGAMVKLVTSSVMALFDTYLDQPKSSLAHKKSRLIFANYAPSKIMQKPLPNQVTDIELNFTLHNYANVFCREQVDIGARYLLKHLPKLNQGAHTVIDLGCGNGILGVSLLQQYPHATCYFVDESYMAIASAQETYKQSDAEGHAEFLISHSLSNFPAEKVDTIICNPPFHQQNTVIDDIAWQMFVDAKQCLKVGGELRLVGNRHLDHRAKLSKLFGGCTVIASDNKFVILSAIKKAK